METASKGQVLSIEPVPPQKTKRLCLGIAIFVCWAFVAASVLTFFIIRYPLAKNSTRLDLDIHEPWYLRREDWQAIPENGMDFLVLPVHNVIIGHSATNQCTERYECIRHVLAIQSHHQGLGWFDIGPNFLVGGDGLVFEGRGANLIGIMVSGWNSISITIMFLGNYIENVPVQNQFDNVNVLLNELVNVGVLSPTYTVYGHCQVSRGIESPGPNLLDNLHNFSNWNPVNKTSCPRG